MAIDATGWTTASPANGGVGRGLRSRFHEPVEQLELRAMFCYTGEGTLVDPLDVHSPAAQQVDKPVSRRRLKSSLGTSYTMKPSSASDLQSSAALVQAVSAADTLGGGYTPLAPSPSPWATGYFAQSDTVDLQAGAALAPDTSLGEAASLPRSMPVNANGLPLLNSRPNGDGTEIFLDFARNDGSLGTYSIDGDRSNWNFQEELNIYNCWRQVVAYFAPYNVNVTTVIPPTGSADPNFAWLQVSNEYSGGAAYVGWLGKEAPHGWVNSGMVTDRVTGIIHELSHIFNLNHQAEFDANGNKTDEYSDGTSYREGPIIGVDYAQTIHKWIYGRPSTDVNYLQDDVALIAGTASWSNGNGGDGFRPDDFGDTTSTAYALTAGGQQLDGFTERYGDADVFKISPTTSGPWTITATPLYGSADEPKLELLDSNGNIIAGRDDADQRFGPTNEQFLNVNLNAGTYYVRVSSGGDYDELGYYQFAATQLPANFVSNDVGTPGYDGNVAYNASTGVFTQAGGGTDIWNTSDQFRFTYAQLTGDGSITARVDGLDNIGWATKAGVMIRQSLAGNSAHGFLGVKPDGTIDSIWRSAAGASAANVNNSGSGPWVRISRSGNVFTYQSSGDGTNWNALGTTTVSMSGPVLIGLATCAFSSSAQAFATFSNVSVTGNITPAATTYNGLAAPGNLTAAPAAGANTSINLSWTDVASETGYRIERSVDGVNFATLTTVGANVTSYTDANVWGSMRWFYRVSASNGTSTYSAPSGIANTVNKPNAPTGTPAGYTPSVMNIGGTSIYLNWIDTQGDTGYRVEASANGGAYATLGTTGANQVGYSANSLAPDTSYTFRITPLTSVGDGLAPSLLLTGSTPLPAVSNLRFTSRSATSMAIAWNDLNTETGYRVERSTDNATWTTLTTTAANVTGYTDGTVTAGTEYYYRITGINSHGDGTSNVVFAAAPAASLPSGWSSADVGSVAGGGASVNTGTNAWKLVSGGGDVWGNADAFQFAYKAITTDATIIARVDTLELTDNAAKAGIMFRQDLTAGSVENSIMINAGGGYGIDVRTRTAANAGTGYQQALANVVAPYWLKLVRNGSTITASYSTDGVTYTTAATTTLSLSGTFYVGLAVTSANGNQLNTSTFSNVSVTTPAAVPAAPSNLTASKLLRKVTLNWTDNATTETGFHVWSSRDGVNWTLLTTTAAGSGSGSTLSYTTGRLSTGTWYFRTSAYNSAGDSPYSNVVSIVV